jgi:nitroimidazol reductase NimA-like FMN-containing flavoprotein (pyridoxamine 5'-phosphate oxidase superfamily)
MSNHLEPPLESAVSQTITPTDRSRIRRVPARASYDRAVVEQILDQGVVAHVGLAVEGQPYVMPMVYARRDRELYLHGAAASRLLKAGAQGVPLCATVTLVDGLVFARSAFHHSMNFRSVVVLGRARAVLAPDEKCAALAAFLEHVARGRAAACRPPSAKELAATTVLALPLDEVSAKVRAGGPRDDDEDLALPFWAGHVPLQLVAGAPVPDASSPPLAPVPPAFVSGLFK